MKILVTGAGGFVGSRLCETLVEKGIDVVAAFRRRPLENGLEALTKPSSAQSGAIVNIAVGDLARTDWSGILAGIDTAIHLAGRAHRSNDYSHETYQLYHDDNVVATRRLAEACVQAGVRRFVFLSSVKVMGECSPRSAFSEADIPQPEDIYGITKLEAEQLLFDIANRRQLELVIVRAPLVYGPGVRANFLRLMRLIDAGFPLPLGNANNLRSLIFLDNLVNSLIVCGTDIRAAGVYFVCDRELLSVRKLLEQLAFALNKNARFFSLPKGLLAAIAKLVGRNAEFRRLFEPLVVSSGKIERELDWTPPFSAAAGISATARGFHKSRGRSRR